MYSSPSNGWVLKGEGMGYKKQGKEISCGLRLVEASLRLGDNHAEGYDKGEDKEGRD